MKYEGKEGHLISKDNSSEAVILAQKKYTLCQIEDINRKEAALKDCLSIFESPSKAEDLSSRSGFSELLEMANQNQIEYFKKWEAAEYKKSDYKSEFLIHKIIKGDMVRSKAEALIADTLYRHSLPYRYDQEMRFGSSICFPDFVILSNGRDFLWEHMGLLSKEDYSRTNLSKISTYLAYGYFPGDNLLITSETQERPLSSCIVERIIDCFLIL